ncbi:MAG: 30S ribosomal protein S15 [Candidatus Poseidoniia archaeon]|jgi:small subunit ribosomal protein S15|nr:30S ribosomal protein S15 [Candidatus Poseidoniia archaeon]|tara:strand:- start:1113 stop:1565 length:453 start_codon:yes stop_codon:yes gene_type:complete
MARIHARRKGRSGSSPQTRQDNPKWSPKAKDVEKKIVELASEGHSTSQIGIALRDTHAVPSVKLAMGKSISKVLAEKELSPLLPEDLTNLMRKAVRLGEHLKVNKKDNHNTRSLHLTEAKILRLAKYYRSNNVIPTEWKYSLSNAKLLVG